MQGARRHGERDSRLLYVILGVALGVVLTVVTMQGQMRTSVTTVHAAAAEHPAAAAAAAAAASTAAASTAAASTAAASTADGAAAAHEQSQRALDALVERYQEEQRQFCRELAAGAEHPMGTPANETYVWRQVTAEHDGSTVNFDMWVLTGSDIVSNSIMSGGAWEPAETAAVLDRLAEWRDMHLHDSNQTTLLDIGSNVGWFALNAAALGYRVLAAEPMSKNIGAIRRSLCSNPDLQSRLTLISKGLSHKPDKCSFYVKKTNRGNGVTVCKDSGTASMVESTQYEKVGEYELSTIDEIFTEAAPALRGHLPVIKIDVEGFEPNAYAGGQRFFDTIKPKYIMAEVNEEYAGQGFRTTPPLALLKLYDEMCYDIHLDSFHGQLLDRSDFVTTAAQRLHPGALMNIYCVRRQGCRAMDLR